MLPNLSDKIREKLQRMECPFNEEEVGKFKVAIFSMLLVDQVEVQLWMDRILPVTTLLFSRLSTMDGRAYMELNGRLLVYQMVRVIYHYMV